MSFETPATSVWSVDAFGAPFIHDANRYAVDGPNGTNACELGDGRLDWTEDGSHEPGPSDPSPQTGDPLSLSRLAPHIEGGTLLGCPLVLTVQFPGAGEIRVRDGRAVILPRDARALVDVRDPDIVRWWLTVLSAGARLGSERRRLGRLAPATDDAPTRFDRSRSYRTLVEQIREGTWAAVGLPDVTSAPAARLHEVAMLAVDLTRVDAREPGTPGAIRTLARAKPKVDENGVRLWRLPFGGLRLRELMPGIDTGHYVRLTSHGVRAERVTVTWDDAARLMSALVLRERLDEGGPDHLLTCAVDMLDADPADAIRRHGELAALIRRLTTQDVAAGVLADHQMILRAA